MSEDTSQRFVASFDSGDIIFREGESGSEMFIIKSGQVAIWKDLNGERNTLTVLEKGDFFGEMSLLEGSPRTATAEAVGSTELMRIDGATFSNMVRQNVEIAVRMMRKLSSRLRLANARLAELKGEGTPDLPEPPSQADPEPSDSADHGASLQIEGTSRIIPVWKKEMKIGRFDPVTGEHPDVDLSDEELGRSVSRRHVRVVERAGCFYVVGEIGTLNPTVLNGVTLDPATLTELGNGDLIELGSIRIRFQLS